RRNAQTVEQEHLRLARARVPDIDRVARDGLGPAAGMKIRYHGDRLSGASAGLRRPPIYGNIARFDEIASVKRADIQSEQRAGTERDSKQSQPGESRELVEVQWNNRERRESCESGQTRCPLRDLSALDFKQLKVTPTERVEIERESEKCWAGRGLRID